MSTCPNWRQLVQDRDDQPPTAALEQRWESALSHRNGCPKCQAAAIQVDPLLAFQGLGGFELTPAEEAWEIEETRRVVAAMRTGQRLTENEGPTRRLRTVARATHAREWGVAAMLTIALLGVGTGRMTRPTVLASAHLPTTTLTPTATAVPARMPFQPGFTTVEGLDRPNARVYQLRGDHLSVVMIVDKKLNV
jgi:hypothetical protein